MSYILDALKRAEQRDQRRKAPKSREAEPAAESSAWLVKMVSPARYARFRLKTGEDDPRGLPKGAAIAAAVLTLLLLIECVLVYDNRARMSAIAIEVGKLTRQISEAEGRITKTEGQRLSLKLENDSLRRELELASADLDRARSALQTLGTGQKRVGARKRQPTVTEQKRSRALPLASAPPQPMSYGPPGTERRSELDMVDTASVTAYSVR